MGYAKRTRDGSNCFLYKESEGCPETYRPSDFVAFALNSPIKHPFLKGAENTIACPDGSNPIGREACEKAGRRFVGEVDWRGAPSGCIVNVYLSRSGDVLWNKNPTNASEKY